MKSLYRSTNKAAAPPRRITLLGADGGNAGELAGLLQDAGHSAGQAFDIHHDMQDAHHGLVFLICAAGATSAQLAQEHALRSRLMTRGDAFQVLHGDMAEQLAQMLQGLHIAEAGTSAARKTWVWVCDKCSDPACEHQLLSGLLAARAS